MRVGFQWGGEFRTRKRAIRNGRSTKKRSKAFNGVWLKVTGWRSLLI